MDHAVLWAADQFPYWDGYRITHDPVYTAYSAPVGTPKPTTSVCTSPTEQIVSELGIIGLGTSFLIAPLALTIPVLLRVRARKYQ